MKAALRAQMISQRDSLSSEQRLKASLLLLEKFHQIPLLQGAKCLALYFSFGSEISTHGLIKGLLKKDRQVLLPRIKAKGPEMELAQVHHWDQLVPGPFKILQPPKEAPAFALKQVDVIAIPGLAFDFQGHRLGWGQGFYDRLLSAKSSTYRLGFCHDFQVLEAIPKDPWDQALHAVLTDKRFIKVK